MTRNRSGIEKIADDAHQFVIPSALRLTYNRCDWVLRSLVGSASAGKASVVTLQDL